MKHFSSADWIDFVNGVTKSGEAGIMQKHLDSGCKRCLEAVAMWRKVRQAGAAEGSYQPPLASLRVAKALFSPRKPAKAQRGISMIFDSFMQPALVGVRSSGNDIRQLLYRVGDLQLDLCVGTTADGKKVVVTGQLMNAKKPEQAMRRSPLLVSDGKGLILGAETNDFGEFRAEIPNTGDLELKLPNAQGKHHVISLHEVLGRLAGGL
jgi:hypothetical protein